MGLGFQALGFRDLGLSVSGDQELVFQVSAVSGFRGLGLSVKSVGLRITKPP